MEEQEFLTCPFCGKDDIKFGAIVCGDCKAEIAYGCSYLGWLLAAIVLLVIGLGSVGKSHLVLFLAYLLCLWEYLNSKGIVS